MVKSDGLDLVYYQLKVKTLSGAVRTGLPLPAGRPASDGYWDLFPKTMGVHGLQKAVGGKPCSVNSF
jgi:hypothetical protein